MKTANQAQWQQLCFITQFGQGDHQARDNKRFKHHDKKLRLIAPEAMTDWLPPTPSGRKAEVNQKSREAFKIGRLRHAHYTYAIMLAQTLLEPQDTTP